MRLAVRQLSKAFGFLWALREINLEIGPGECIALLGPNGAGKTTLLKLLSLLLDPTAGQIELDGQRLQRGSSAPRSAIGFLSPNEHLYENLTARENLLFFNSLYGKVTKPAELEEVLDAVGLSRFQREYVSSLSSGMKCRLSIAKWLLIEPKLILLDEPFGALDGSGVDLLEGYVKSSCQRGGVAVIATHHVSRVLGLCTRAIILDQGKLIFDEPRREPWESLHRAFGAFLPRGERWIS